MVCGFPEKAGVQGFSKDPFVYLEARDWGGFGATVSYQDRLLSLKLCGVCNPPS